MGESSSSRGFSVTSSRHGNVQTLLLAALAVIALGAALKTLYFVLMPLAFAFYLAVLVYPIQRRMTIFFPPSLAWMGTVSAMGLILAVLAAGVGAAWLCAKQLLVNSPDYAELFLRYRNRAVAWVESLGIPVSSELTDTEQVLRNALGIVRAVAWSGWSLAAMTALVFFFVLLMLLEASRWRLKATEIMPHLQDGVVLDTIEVMAVRLRQYLWVTTVCGIITGAINGVWLWYMGVDFALLWGLLAFLLNYIPNVGSIIAGTLPSLLAVVMLGPADAIITIAGLALVEQVMGNFVQPRMQGRRLELSPLMALFSVVFWGWAWGVAGAFLAVPLTITMVIVFAHVPALRSVALLLSRTPHYEVLEQKTDAEAVAAEKP